MHILWFPYPIFFSYCTDVVYFHSENLLSFELPIPKYFSNDEYYIKRAMRSAASLKKTSFQRQLRIYLLKNSFEKRIVLYFSQNGTKTTSLAPRFVRTGMLSKSNRIILFFFFFPFSKGQMTSYHGLPTPFLSFFFCYGAAMLIKDWKLPLMTFLLMKYTLFYNQNSNLS